MWPEEMTYAGAMEKREEIFALRELISDMTGFLQLLLDQRRIDPSLRGKAEELLRDAHCV